MIPLFVAAAAAGFAAFGLKVAGDNARDSRAAFVDARAAARTQAATAWIGLQDGAWAEPYAASLEASATADAARADTAATRASRLAAALDWALGAAAVAAVALTFASLLL